MTETVEDMVNLNTVVEILHITIHRPRLTRKVANVNLSVGGQELNSDNVTKPSWKLLPAELASELDAIESAAGKLIDEYSARFCGTVKIGGVQRYALHATYCVPKNVVPTLLHELDVLNTQLKQAVSYWAEREGEFNELIKRQLGAEQYELARKQIPKIRDLVASTGIFVVSLPIGQTYDTIQGHRLDGLLSQSRDEARKMINSVMENLVAGPRQELSEALENFQKIISNGSRIRERSVEVVRRAFRRLKLFDFVADTTLAQKIAALDSQLSTAVGDSTTDALNHAIRAVQEEATAVDSLQAQIGALRLCCQKQPKNTLQSTPQN